jgi:hypothetical protein
MAKLGNLPRARLKKTLAELARTRAEVRDEIRKSEFNRAKSRLARKRRRQKEKKPPPRLTVV